MPLLVGSLGIYRFYGGTGLVTVEATIQQIDAFSRKNHRVYVTYEHGGQTHPFIGLGRWSREMEVGDPVEVRTDPETPGTVVWQGGGIMPVIVGPAPEVFSLRMFPDKRDAQVEERLSQIPVMLKKMIDKRGNLYYNSSHGFRPARVMLTQREIETRR